MLALVMSAVNPTLDIPKEPAVRRAWVIYQLRVRGLSLSQLAKEVGVSQQAMSEALMRPSSHLEPVIAEALGVAVEQLFPERFGAAGNRLFREREPQRSSGAKARNVKGRRVA